MRREFNRGGCQQRLSLQRAGGNQRRSLDTVAKRPVTFGRVVLGAEQNPDQSGRRRGWKVKKQRLLVSTLLLTSLVVNGMSEMDQKLGED